MFDIFTFENAKLVTFDIYLYLLAMFKCKVNKWKILLNKTYHCCTVNERILLYVHSYLIRSHELLQFHSYKFESLRLFNCLNLSETLHPVR